MELKIDHSICDLGTDPVAVPGYAAARTGDIDACREGRSLKITLPRTPRNDAVTGFADDPDTAVRFNAGRRGGASMSAGTAAPSGQSEPTVRTTPAAETPPVPHTAELTADGAVLLAGTVHLLAVTNEGYELEIREGGTAWANNAALRTLDKLEIGYSADLTPTTIVESWSDASPVKFFPIHRDEYEQQNSSTDLLPAERMLSVDDYHPFLHVATLVEAIFRESGYRLRSELLTSPFFRSLYMSGSYASRNTAAAAARMGFFARRLKPATASADTLGRVYADPYAATYSVGNIVETAAPLSLDADGLPVPELQNNGGCFTVENKRIVFRPLAEVSAGFEYYLKYTTGHRILSRTQLRGFDSFYLGAGAKMAFSLPNRYEDRRKQLSVNHAYRIVVFDHTAGRNYRLTYSLDGVLNTVMADFASRSTAVATPAAGKPADPVLWYRSNNLWYVYGGDWAMYDGYIGETGETTVEVRLRTPAEIISPDAPKTFDRIYFYGAEPGTPLTLHKECSLRPRFVASPGFGSRITFADVARGGIRQSEVLEAVGHLFNLRFYTEQATRTVYIEPAEALFGIGSEVDWRAKCDLSQPVVRTQTAPEIHERRTWCYQQGDGAVKRFESAAQTDFGAWTFSAGTFAAKPGEKVLRNPLFRPSVSLAGGYADAPSALLLQVGDRDATEEDGTNFTPRIVRFAGMHPLPDGERWGYPSGAAAYPLAAFHFAGDEAAEGFTLCFEDRDGLSGLHRYYDRQVLREAAGERITLHLRLDPDEFEALFTPGTGAPDIRSVFRLDTGQSVVRAALHSIESYDPAAASVRCTFTRLI